MSTIKSSKQILEAINRSTISSNRANIATLANNIIRLLTYHKISIRGLSRGADVAQPHISRIINQEHESPGLRVLTKLAAFFGLEVGQLIGERKIDWNALPELPERVRDNDYRLEEDGPIEILNEDQSKTPTPISQNTTGWGR